MRIFNLLPILFIVFSGLRVQGAEQMPSRPQEILKSRLSWDNYWAGNWVIGRERRVRFIEIQKGIWMAAIEVFEGDFGRADEIKWQVAFVSASQAPNVDFVFLPCTPSGFDFEGRKVTKHQIDALESNKGCFEVKIRVQTLNTKFKHGREWRSRIKALEKEIISEIEFLKLTGGSVIVFDIGLEHEDVQGIILSKEENVFDVSGEFFTEKDAKNSAKSYAILRVHSEDSVDVWKLNKILKQPLVWRFETHQNKVGLIQVNAFK